MAWASLKKALFLVEGTSKTVKKPKLQIYSVLIAFEDGAQTGYPILAESQKQALEVVKRSLAVLKTERPGESWRLWTPTGDVTLCDPETGDKNATH